MHAGPSKRSSVNQALHAHRNHFVVFCADQPCRKRLKELMEHATQFPEQYSKVASVQKKVSTPLQLKLAVDGRCQAAQQVVHAAADM